MYRRHCHLSSALLLLPKLSRKSDCRPPSVCITRASESEPPRPRCGFRPSLLRPTGPAARRTPLHGVSPPLLSYTPPETRRRPPSLSPPLSNRPPAVSSEAASECTSAPPSTVTVIVRLLPAPRTASFGLVWLQRSTPSSTDGLRRSEGLPPTRKGWQEGASHRMYLFAEQAPHARRN